VYTDSFIPSEIEYNNASMLTKGSYF
jgi:hypothetical protein